ncbi:hypothetical protein MKW92_033793 [Papaver armeniacum]|nr:hypothetical protein MKW92_033793 [Papaver armeniacum]
MALISSTATNTQSFLSKQVGFLRTSDFQKLSSSPTFLYIWEPLSCCNIWRISWWRIPIIYVCPPRIPLSEADLQIDLDRRRPGQSRITTPRKETDTCKITSGVADGLTIGTPIHVSVPNTDQRGHESSARETIARVAAGALAKKILKLRCGTEILAYVSQVHKVILPEDLVDPETLTLDQVGLRCVCVWGGVVTCIARRVPRGLGSPVFDKLEAELTKAMLSIPATKYFEIGSGIGGTFMTGSEHNDEFYIDESERIRTRTNRSGISNGEIINLRVGFKPTSAILMEQRTVTRDKQEIQLRARGRHDPCVVPRDQLMAHHAHCALFPINPALWSCQRWKKY